jgi:hypothetical protein
VNDSSGGFKPSADPLTTSVILLGIPKVSIPKI